MSATEPPIQTFGIELELLCLHPEPLPTAVAAERPYCGLVIDAVYEALVRRGVPVSDHNSLSINDGAPAYSQWRVEEEVLSLINEEEALLPTGYTCEALELASRKFTYQQDDWRSEIFTVLDTLREMEDHGVKFITNASTGFHVHVGYHDRFVPLRTAKNVFLLTTAYESLLDEIHTATRIDIPWGKEERHHCWPLSFFASKRGHGNTIFQRLQYIERAASYEQIGSAFFISAEEMGTDEQCTGHNAAVNFDNLFPDPENDRHAETLTGTIEFRQHAGTLNFSAIVAWIDLTGNIVRHCEEVQQDAQWMGMFVDLLAEAATSTSSREEKWTSLLGEAYLDLPADSYAYYTDLLAGTLPQTTHIISPLHTPLLHLLDQNLLINLINSCREVVRSVIASKYANGIYGHDPTTVPFALLDDDVGAELMEYKCKESEAEGCLGWDEEELSTALPTLFQLLAQEQGKAVQKALP